MKNNWLSKIIERFSKLKKNKNFLVFIAVGLAVLIAIIYFSSLLGTNDKNSSTKEDNIETNFSTSEEYVIYLENKLENVISQVKGAGNVDVIVTLEKGFEYVYLTEEETKTSANGITTTTTTVVMVDGEPVLTEEIYPIIKGIVIVSAGANDVAVKMNILTLIQTVVDVDSSKISIFTSK